MIYTIKHKAIILLAIATLISSVVILIFSITEKSPFYYDNVPFPPIVENVYEVGDEVRFIVGRCAKRPVSYVLTRTFVNDNSVGIPPRYIAGTDDVNIPEAGCKTVVGLPNIVPSGLTSGMYHMEFTVSVKGKTRDFIFTRNTTSFKIENPNPTPIIIQQVLPYSKNTTTTLQNKQNTPDEPPTTVERITTPINNLIKKL